MACSNKKLADVFKMVGDPIRLGILLVLGAEGSKNVGELCDSSGMSQPALSHHLALMRAYGLVEARRAGKFVYYGLDKAGEAAVKAAQALAECMSA